MKQRESAVRIRTENGSRTGKRNVPSWINWQSALYLLVLGLVCTFLAPLTDFWWIVPVLGAVVPITLAVLDKPRLASSKPNEKGQGAGASEGSGRAGRDYSHHGRHADVANSG